jgi:preprotein translocase subunit SecY
MPILIQKLFTNNVPFIFGGTGLLIIVSISLDIISQIEGYFISKKYDYFSKKNYTRIRVRSKS